MWSVIKEVPEVEILTDKENGLLIGGGSIIMFHNQNII